MKRILLLLGIITLCFFESNAQSFELTPDKGSRYKSDSSYLVIGNNTFNQSQSGGILFNEDSENDYNCGFGFLHDGQLNKLFLTSGCVSNNPAQKLGRDSVMTFNRDGNIGFGTTTPISKLDISNSSTGSSNPSLRLNHSSATGFNRISFANETRANSYLISANIGATIPESRWNVWHNTTGNILTATGDGMVGIGIGDPTQKLNIRNGNILLETGTTDKVLIEASGGSSAGEITLYASNGNKTMEVKGSDATNKAGEILMYDPTTNLKTLEIDGDWGSSGKSRIVVDELQITGGADFAEYFNMVGEIVPEVGSVLSVSGNGSANLEISNKPYDSNVVGVLSGANGVNPGIMLKQKDNDIANGDYPVAITGRVYVKAEAYKNEIKPGDLLTSSDKAGFAMKATKKKKYAGAIIGKALTGLQNEEGFVLVLLGVK